MILIRHTDTDCAVCDKRSNVKKRIQSLFSLSSFAYEAIGGLSIDSSSETVESFSLFTSGSKSVFIFLFFKS